MGPHFQSGRHRCSISLHKVIFGEIKSKSTPWQCRWYARSPLFKPGIRIGHKVLSLRFSPYG